MSKEKELKKLLWMGAIYDNDCSNILSLHHRWMRFYGYNFHNIVILERILEDICYNCKALRYKSGFRLIIFNLYMVCAFCRDLVRICPNIRPYPYKGGVDMDSTTPISLDEKQIAGILGLVQFYTDVRNLTPHDRNPYTKRKPLRALHRTLAHVNHQIFYERFFYCLYHIFKLKLPDKYFMRIRYTLNTIKHIYVEKWVCIRTHRFLTFPKHSLYTRLLENCKSVTEDNPVIQLPTITETELLMGLRNSTLFKLIIENILGVLNQNERMLEYDDCPLEDRCLQLTM